MAQTAAQYTFSLSNSQGIANTSEGSEGLTVQGAPNPRNGAVIVRLQMGATRLLSNSTIL